MRGWIPISTHRNSSETVCGDVLNYEGLNFNQAKNISQAIWWYRQIPREYNWWAEISMYLFMERTYVHCCSLQLVSPISPELSIFSLPLCIRENTSGGTFESQVNLGSVPKMPSQTWLTGLHMLLCQIIYQTLRKFYCCHCFFH